MLENEIRAYTLRNSIEYGSTTAGNVLPKLFMHGLKKEDIKTIMPIITKIVNEINKLMGWLLKTLIRQVLKCHNLDLKRYR